MFAPVLSATIRLSLRGRQECWNAPMSFGEVRAATPQSKCSKQFVIHHAVGISQWRECCDIQVVVQVSKVTLRHLRLLHVWKVLNSEFPSSQCLGDAALDEVLFVDCNEEAARFLVRGFNGFIQLKMSVVYVTPFFHSALSILDQVQTKYDLHGC